MKIGPFTSFHPLPPLPTETIEHIITYFDLLQDVILRQRSLWACCLLSRSWYAGTVKTLYRTPVITGRNFDKFSRTICPPVHSKTRAVGLENLVADLDMGTLAYESTKSLTARLLRRTRNSLETFIAPAVSFSLAGLAPLSKSLRLRTLDLSNDYYHIDLNELLRSIRDIEHLEYLSLPRSALHTTSLSISRFTFKWPLSLTYLQINGALPDDTQGWNGLLESLPESLRVLAFEHLRDLSPFSKLQHSHSAAPQIKRISIGEPVIDYQIELKGIFTAFPGVLRMRLAMSSWDPSEFLHAPVESKLEKLSLWEGAVRCIVLPQHLVEFAEPLRSLRRIELPENCLQVTRQADLASFERLQNMLDGRKPPGTKLETGLFVTGGGLFELGRGTNNFWVHIE